MPQAQREAGVIPAFFVFQRRRGFSMPASYENIPALVARRRDGGYIPGRGTMENKAIKPWYRSTALIVGVVMGGIGGLVFVIAKHLAALMP
jgi:hypothetical protein